MATHGIGYFVLVVQDRSGRAQHEIEAVSRSGRPVVGDRFHLLGTTYVVDHVDFKEDESPKLRNDFYPVLFLRPLGARPTGGGDDPDKPRIFPSTHEGGRKVLPFQPPAGTALERLSAAYFPASLVLNLVAVGYRAQASDFDNDRRLAFALLRTPAGQDLKPTLPDDLGELSRLAKQNLVECLTLCGEAAVAQPLIRVADENEGAAANTPFALDRRGELWVITAAA